MCAGDAIGDGGEERKPEGVVCQGSGKGVGESIPNDCA